MSAPAWSNKRRESLRTIPETSEDETSSIENNFVEPTNIVIGDSIDDELKRKKSAPNLRFVTKFAVSYDDNCNNLRGNGYNSRVGRLVAICNEARPVTPIINCMHNESGVFNKRLSCLSDNNQDAVLSKICPKSVLPPAKPARHFYLTPKVFATEELNNILQMESENFSIQQTTQQNLPNVNEDFIKQSKENDDKSVSVSSSLSASPTPKTLSKVGAVKRRQYTTSSKVCLLPNNRNGRNSDIVAYKSPLTESCDEKKNSNSTCSTKRGSSLGRSTIQKCIISLQNANGPPTVSSPPLPTKLENNRAGIGLNPLSAVDAPIIAFASPISLLSKDVEENFELSRCGFAPSSSSSLADKLETASTNSMPTTFYCRRRQFIKNLRNQKQNNVTTTTTTTINNNNNNDNSPFSENILNSNFKDCEMFRSVSLPDNLKEENTRLTVAFESETIQKKPPQPLSSEEEDEKNNTDSGIENNLSSSSSFNQLREKFNHNSSFKKKDKNLPIQKTATSASTTVPTVHSASASELKAKRAHNHNNKSTTSVQVSIDNATTTTTTTTDDNKDKWSLKGQPLQTGLSSQINNFASKSNDNNKPKERIDTTVDVNIEVFREQSANICASCTVPYKINLIRESERTAVDQETSKMSLIESLNNCSIGSINNGKNVNLKAVEIPLDDSYGNGAVSRGVKIFREKICQQPNLEKLINTPSSTTPFTNGDAHEVVSIDLYVPNDMTTKMSVDLSALGLTIVSGGVNHRSAYVSIESVRENSPAHQAQLKVGDQILSINNELTAGKFFYSVRRMLSEAIIAAGKASKNCINLRVQRDSQRIDYFNSLASVPKNVSDKDNNSNVENNLPIDSFAQFKRKKADGELYFRSSVLSSDLSNSREKFSTLTNIEQSHDNRNSSITSSPISPPLTLSQLVFNSSLNSTNSSGIGSSISPSLSQKSASDDQNSPIQYNTNGKPHSMSQNSPSSLSTDYSSDYRVVSLDSRPTPGRLDDFVPEVERSRKMNALKSSTWRRKPFNETVHDDTKKFNSLDIRRSSSTGLQNNEPRLIRNYDLQIVDDDYNNTSANDMASKYQHNSIAQRKVYAPTQKLIAAEENDAKMEGANGVSDGTLAYVLMSTGVPAETSTTAKTTTTNITITDASANSGVSKDGIDETSIGNISTIRAKLEILLDNKHREISIGKRKRNQQSTETDIAYHKTNESNKFDNENNASNCSTSSTESNSTINSIVSNKNFAQQSWPSSLKIRRRPAQNVESDSDNDNAIYNELVVNNDDDEYSNEGIVEVPHYLPSPSSPPPLNVQKTLDSLINTLNLTLNPDCGEIKWRYEPTPPQSTNQSLSKEGSLSTITTNRSAHFPYLERKSISAECLLQRLTDDEKPKRCRSADVLEIADADAKSRIHSLMPRIYSKSVPFDKKLLHLSTKFGKVILLQQKAKTKRRLNYDCNKFSSSDSEGSHNDQTIEIKIEDEGNMTEIKEYNDNGAGSDSLLEDSLSAPTTAENSTLTTHNEKEVETKLLKRSIELDEWNQDYLIRCIKAIRNPDSVSVDELISFLCGVIFLPKQPLFPNINDSWSIKSNESDNNPDDKNSVKSQEFSKASANDDASVEINDPIQIGQQTVMNVRKKMSAAGGKKKFHKMRKTSKTSKPANKLFQLLENSTVTVEDSTRELECPIKKINDDPNNWIELKIERNENEIHCQNQLSVNMPTPGMIRRNPPKYKKHLTPSAKTNVKRVHFTCHPESAKQFISSVTIQPHALSTLPQFRPTPLQCAPHKRVRQITCGNSINALHSVRNVPSQMDAILRIGLLNCKELPIHQAKPIYCLKEKSPSHCEQTSRTILRFYDRNNQLIENPKEWRQFIAEQGLPEPGNAASRNRIEADSRFQITHLPMDQHGKTPKPIIKAVQQVPSMAEIGQKCTPVNKSEPCETKKSINNNPPPVITVSGKHRCAHCNMELGRGAAMIVESLSLFYHLSCFRCYVCNIALGNGTRGADVRVRGSKLHCQKCFSTDKKDLKLSQI